ncbi:Type 1 glutamine amidotransferase-like domain-containing protein [Rothia dentocariosa]|uniref:Type 1 glutamine amidotransferase-like domain-containing protein n=1 Tax=Rothia dentocariosa TaxID=2047 RepID=UPI0028EECB32|nr:Type 1 glutamine amidotransferase-like domain-containing protein [Rothia dentocariosa]
MCTLAYLKLFRRTEPNLEEFIRRQDIIYVGGGNTANLLAAWRLHGLSYGGVSNEG